MNYSFFLNMWCTIIANNMPNGIEETFLSFNTRYIQYQQFINELKQIVALTEENFRTELPPWLVTLNISDEDVEAVRNLAFKYDYSVNALGNS